MKNKTAAFLILILIFLAQSGLAASPANYSIKGGKVYLNLKNADISSVLQIFAKATNTNIVAADDVTGKVTVTFSGIDPKKGLEAVLTTQGLDWYEESGTIFVSASRTMRTYFMQYIKADEVVEALKTLLAEGDSVSLNASNNALVVRTKSNNFRRIEALLKQLDILPKQVVVEAKIIEVGLGDAAAVGLDIKYTSPRDVNDMAQTKNLAYRPTDSNAMGMYAQILSQNLETYISALEKAGPVNLVASPRITAINHKEASILIGRRLGYKTAIISQTQTTEQINFLNTGTNLTFTPHISDDGYIRMVVAPKVSDGEIVDDLPREKTTETKNEVMVKDGQTFVIGGLIQDKQTQLDSGIPILMRIPYLGALFRQSEMISEKVDLLIFITPHIVDDGKLVEMQQNIKSMEKYSEENKARLIH